MKEEILNKILEPRRPVYKRVKAVAEFCPVCKERLVGNNSHATPWKCACGEWEIAWQTDLSAPYFYKIKTKPQ